MILRLFLFSNNLSGQVSSRLSIPLSHFNLRNGELFTAKVENLKI